jgi:KinB signaling pathway activation protein
VKSRDLVYLFFSTIIISGISAIAIGLLLRWEDVDGFIGFFAVLLWLFGYGAIWSLISQMGFFAYLTIHRFGLGIFKSVSLWNKVQVVVIAFILFDLFYLRYKGDDLLYHLAIPLGLLALGWIVAYRKKQQTNKEAFIPTLFFIIVVTTLEWIPALRSDDQVFLWLSFIPLMTANIWQVLTLHKLHNKK